MKTKISDQLKTIYKGIPILIVGFLICGCEPEDPQDDFIYPLAVGNSWEYHREWTQYFYTDTSEAKQYDDTLRYCSDISVSIPGKLTLKDSIETYEMIATEVVDTTDFNPVQNQTTGIKYYKNNSDGLYIYAFDRAGGWLVFPKRKATKSVCFKDLEFRSFRELSHYIQQLIPTSRILGDSIHFEEPPVKTLQYPLRVGDRWTYRSAHDPWRMDRVVEKKKKMELEIGPFDCYQVKFLYDMDHDGEWDEDIWITDYISNEGLIRRQVTVQGVTVTTIDDPEGNRKVDATDIYTLTDFML